ncbi:MAG: hypothetical protein A2176_16085 [Spirochaetes bacterium RBG_13_51_14]|nr:MAG: hypothetical protein A2176_16085 [Spirochaetes bacterium RBG_13_51_14]
MIQERRYVTIEETAALLAVSSATVRNWVKHEYLRPARRPSGIMFRADDVRALADRIRSGDVRRLASRANKATSARSFIPDEYLDRESARGAIEKIVSFIVGVGIDRERALFILALRRFLAEGICAGRDLAAIARGGFHIPGREYASRELINWHAALGSFTVTEQCAPLLGLDLPRQRDILGLIYQSLLREGDKATSGSYYTPDHIVSGIAADSAGPGARILDPCCGTGQFLLAFAERSRDPLSLHGSDVDDCAVRIARVNMMLAFPDRDFEPRIHRSNFMLDERFGIRGERGFDVIATNPPWGMHYAREELNRLRVLHPEIRSSESYSYFLKKSIDLLRNGGALSFILPESLLYVKSHGDIRNYILKHCRIERIIRLGRVFKNVFTPVIRLDLVKGGRPGMVRSISGGGAHAVDQNRFRGNGDFIFDISVSSMDVRILDRVYGREHTTLEGGADWALGIVTGDNEKYLNGSGSGGYEPIYRGRDVDHYFLLEPSAYIRFTPDKFQQAAPEEKYRAREKLVYRFISKGLVVAYDNRGSLTLNSANILIPQAERYPLKAVLALFNSSLYQFIFQKKFSSIKVLRSHLERLPLPLWDTDALNRLVYLADRVLQCRTRPELVDTFIMDQCGLTGTERAHVLQSVS